MRFFLLCIFFSTSLVFGTIIETPHFKEVLNHIDSNTLVVLDIDDTLLIPAQTLGTDIWFLHRGKQHEKAGLSRAVAFEKALAEWEAIRQLTNVSIVEEGTQAIIASLQDKNVPVMGLTTQGLALATRTIQQLQSLGIDLTPSAPSKEDHYFINEHGVLYRHGVLFTSGTQKGKALIKLLEINGLQPQHVLFINDKEKHLKEVESVLENLGIAFTGLRYSYSDSRIAAFDPALADIQWKHSSFDHILSDEEAAALLKNY